MKIYGISLGKIIGRGCLILLALFIISIPFKTCSVYRGCIRHENGIIAADNHLAAVISSKDNILAGQSEVVLKYKDMLLEAIDKTTKGTFGEDGSEAVMQWIKTNYPNMDSDVFKKIQQAVETWFTNIQMANDDEIARVNVYRNYYQDPANVAFTWALGFPKIDMKKYGTPIVTKNAKKEQETRESTEKKLFN